MSITHEAYLNIVPGDSPAPIIKVSQYDADFSIVFHLIAKKRGVVPAYPRTVENDEDVTINVPTSATVSVRGTKTDGNGYSAAATLSGTATAPIVTVAGHEQMTASAGVNVYEITFYADNATKRLSTANFILFVEPAALDASTITSESLMLELNDLIASVPNAVAAADRAEAAAQSVSSSAAQIEQNRQNIADNTQDISDIKADLDELEPGLSDDAKTALLNCFEHVAWVDEHGQNYYNALANALYPSPVSISAVFSPGQNKIYDTDSLDDLKQYLTVTGTYTDGSTREINDYVLSGTLAHGTSTVTVTKDDKTTTFNVTVEYLTVEWNYTDGLPTDNGFAIYASRGTSQMTANGYSMVSENVSDTSYRLYHSWPDLDTEYTKVILEWKFVIDGWGSYNTVPYMNGVRLGTAFGNRGGNMINSPSIILNQSGVTSWHPTQSSRYNHDVLNAYNFAVGNEYTVRFELDTTRCKIYVNNTLVATETSDYYIDASKSSIWGVSRGAAITVKSYKEQRGVS